MDASLSKENRASTSVDTLPGTMFRISFPNATSNRSRAESTWLSKVSPYFSQSASMTNEAGVVTSHPPTQESHVSRLTCSFPYLIDSSISLAYSDFFEAAKISEGFVVAS